MTETSTTAPDPAPTAADGAPGSDADRLAREPSTACLNCGAVLPGRFCPSCGQKDQPIRQPAHVFIAESVSEYFGLDGRLWRSFGALLFRPGALTEAYLEGRRTHYLRPLRLYLTATVLCFFLLSLLDPLAERRGEIVLEPVPADTTMRATALAARVDTRADALEAEQEALRSAAALVGGVPRGAALRAEAARVDSLEARLRAAEDALDALPDDSLVAVAGLPPDVAVALADTGRVEAVWEGPQIAGGVQERLPDWAKGDLARRMEATESPTERRLLLAQYQRAVLGQVPAALFLVLPVFALLLKGAYLGGAGRPRRLRRRPPAPAAGAPWWRRLGHRVDGLRWHLARWSARRRGRKRRRRARNARRRPVRGAYRRARMALAAHPGLRPWRVRRIRSLRRGLRACRPRYYAEHLVFALHVHAFTFLVAALLVLLGFDVADVGGAKGRLMGALGLSIPVYFVLAQKRVYRQSWPRTLAKAAGLGLVYTLVVAGGTVVAAALALRLG